jgi:NADH:ubiquinone oxidoreductase subunit 2 (subunit N)
VTIAFLTSVVSAFYYLGVVNQMYFKEAPEGDTTEPTFATVFIVAAACALILVGTCFAPRLLDWAGTVSTQTTLALKF